MTKTLLMLVFAAGLASPRAGLAQKIAIDSIATADTSKRHEVQLRDGSRLVGRVVAVTPDSVRVVMRAGTVTAARAQIDKVIEFHPSQMHGDVYWPENANPTRLLLSSTAYALKKGEGYYWNAWLFLHGAAVGITDRLSIGGALTIFGGFAPTETPFFITPKFTLTKSPRGGTAIGAMAGVIPNDGDDATSLGILYGVGSLGGTDANVTLGLGWGYVDKELADRPIVMLGGIKRISRRVALISENWFVPIDNGFPGLLTYGVRFLGEKMSFDVAFVSSTESPMALGIPWVGMAVKF